MGLFGGSKSSTTNNNEEFQLSGVDNRIIEGGSVGGNVNIGVGGDSDSMYVTTTDFGALDAASEMVGRSYTSIDNAVNAVQVMAGDTGARLNSALGKVADFATTQTGNDENKTVQYLIIAMAFVGAIYFFKK